MSDQSCRSARNPGRCHVVGVGGVGMSAVARLLLAGGGEVTGSDRSSERGRILPGIARLCGTGLRLVPQDGSAIDESTTAVVYSSAIEDDNPDLCAARRCGTPLVHRSEMLARLLEGRRCLAITGTSGKSTVTAMAGWILDRAGLDPTVVNGAPCLNWRNEIEIGNVRLGGTNLWVIEADESDRSLLNLVPDIAVITNASSDHFDEDETRELFAAFADAAREKVISGLGDAPFLRGLNPHLSADGSRFTFRGVEIRLGVPGRHNAENAVFALEACSYLGVEPRVAADAMASFKGVHRRLERVGETGGVTVVDDYAHNPAKLRAAWEAVVPFHDRVLGVWQPHGYGPLRSSMQETRRVFAGLCRSRDRLYVRPVYDAGGTADRSVRSGDLVDGLRADGVAAVAVEGDEDLLLRIGNEARSGDVVMSMGARDPDLDVFARRILDRVGD